MARDGKSIVEVMDQFAADAVLEFAEHGKPIPYINITEGIVLESRDPESPVERLQRRIVELRLLMMEFNDHELIFVGSEHPIWDDGVVCTVSLDTVLNEDTESWQRRVGEIQLHRRLAEIPSGFKFEFYPEKDA